MQRAGHHLQLGQTHFVVGWGLLLQDSAGLQVLQEDYTLKSINKQYLRLLDVKSVVHSGEISLWEKLICYP